REARRQRRSRYAHQSVPSSSSYAYDPSSTPSKGWFSNLKSVFNKKTNGSSTSSKSRKNGKATDPMTLGRGTTRGWVQAGSGDEWDSGEDGVGNGYGNMNRGMVSIGPSPLPTPNHVNPYNPYSPVAVDSPFRPPTSGTGTRMSTAESISSTYFDSHAITGLGARSGAPSPLPSSPVMSPSTSVGEISPSPTTNAHGLPRTQSPEPMSARSPVAQTGFVPHRKNDSLEVDTRKWSVQSDVSARTQGTGTRFIEGL
ncbi:hypothetical protein V5O48_004306, partial [Marasmius crinis-equi]